MLEHVLTIEFSLEDEFGNNFSSCTRSEIPDDLYDSDLDFIGQQLNAFLKQCGYSRNNNRILMADLNEDEYSSLQNYLEKIREETN